MIKRAGLEEIKEREMKISIKENKEEVNKVCRKIF
jgi:hypothetical protein